MFNTSLDLANACSANEKMTTHEVTGPDIRQSSQNPGLTSPVHVSG